LGVLDRGQNKLGIEREKGGLMGKGRCHAGEVRRNVKGLFSLV